MTGKCHKLIEKARRNPKGLRFEELKSICKCLGMVLDRTHGSHHIYKHEDPTFIVSIQEKDDKAKPYQVRQVLDLMEEFDLE